MLVTVLLTDLVDSTRTQAAMGDRAWKELVSTHHQRVRETLARWGGTEHDTAGDDTAGARDVVVSQTVKDLVAGSGFTFHDRGEHELKGVPDRWRLYTVS